MKSINNLFSEQQNEIFYTVCKCKQSYNSGKVNIFAMNELLVLRSDLTRDDFL